MRRGTGAAVRFRPDAVCAHKARRLWFESLPLHCSFRRSVALTRAFAIVCKAVAGEAVSSAEADDLRHQPHSHALRFPARNLGLLEVWCKP